METCRKQDIVSRIGGDEFLIVLPKTTEQETERIIENINKNCLKFRNKIMRPSISFGYAVKTSNEQKIDQVLKLAEERMYRTKLTESEKVKASIISSMREALNINTTENNEYYNMAQELCLKVGQKVGLNQKTMNDLKLLVQMHDIGKVAISQEILSRCGDDIEGECSLVGKHPEIGYRIAINSPD